MARTSPKVRSLPRRGFQNGRKAPTAEPAPKEVKVGGEKNGSTRLVPVNKAPRYYPAEDVVPPKKHRKVTAPATLRPSITPGTVLILLAGRFRGKRVVFLKQLASGLLLVTGPYKVNGVPLRRVNQAYVIATSTKIDIADVKLDDKINDAYFAKEKTHGSKSAESEFFEDGKPKEKAAYPEAKAEEQKALDKVLIAQIKKTDNLAKYLKASWGLSKGQFPHALVF
ncbi:hypothetical protein BOTBODRAFT_112432 [Botryobasidium botryosum FD-172 SS1]|uniref:60S ribosomal protein L6 n=1 Tax=Botryobasidium botryosum (strain FD-172 SS1) TaxID=930990 RepID=A0A067MAY1_BOTB1|nr:hypothetical protein BOTBODRAFT_112432 [Botryobasidium botryosum FD-172 SS1]